MNVAGFATEYSPRGRVVNPRNADCAAKQHELIAQAIRNEVASSSSSQNEGWVISLGLALQYKQWCRCTVCCRHVYTLARWELGACTQVGTCLKTGTSHILSKNSAFVPFGANRQIYQ